MDTSILTTIKKMLGIEDDTSFDTDIVVYINTAIMYLTQIGVGPDVGFAITDADDVWADFLPTAQTLIPVQQYIYAKVKLIFDPPPTSYVIEAFERSISELEHRIKLQLESASLGGTPFVISPEIL